MLYKFVNPHAMRDCKRLLNSLPIPEKGTRVTVVGYGFKGDLVVGDGGWIVTTDFGIDVVPLN